MRALLALAFAALALPATASRSNRGRGIRAQRADAHRVAPITCPEIQRLTVPAAVIHELMLSDDVYHKMSKTPFSDGVANRVTFIGSGSFGCVYGLAWEGEIVVAAKTSKYIDRRIGPQEISVLQKIHHYRGNVTSKAGLIGGEEDEERLFVFMKYIDGSSLEKTNGYLDQVHRPEHTSLERTKTKCQQSCRTFITRTASKIYDVYLDYVEQFGVAHKDMGTHNMVFSQSWDTSAGEAELIDWGVSDILVDQADIDAAKQRYSAEQFLLFLQRRCD